MQDASELYKVWAYVLYLIWSILATVWVARTLHKNGRIFLVDAFAGNEGLADSVNSLLVAGFYLINIGYVAVALESPLVIDSVQRVIEVFSAKVGWVLLVLGLMHFFNLFVFSRMRRRAVLRHAPPPVRPDAHLPARG
jgi:energy-converting hydrogenase Eha subunit E